MKMLCEAIVKRGSTVIVKIRVSDSQRRER